jgi:8-oxo-dGTP diphosphatase
MSEHETATLAADVVLFSNTAHGWRTLLIRRGTEPFCGRWAFPGGRVGAGETFRDAAVRELLEETGIDVAHRLWRDSVGVYDDPERDPRGRVVSVAFMAIFDAQPTPALSDPGIADADWALVDNLLADPEALAFDHWSILFDAERKLRGR